MDGDPKATRIETVSGKGLLDARAYWASIVGPKRLAMAAKKTVTLFNTKTVEVAKNLGRAGGPSGTYVLAGIGLPFNGPVILPVVFGYEEQLGFNTGFPANLVSTGSWGEQGVFMQLLLPGEQLFCQIMDQAVAQQNVVVATVQF